MYIYTHIIYIYKHIIYIYKHIIYIYKHIIYIYKHIIYIYTVKRRETRTSGKAKVGSATMDGQASSADRSHPPLTNHSLSRFLCVIYRKHPSN
jgi:hypothetical protein